MKKILLTVTALLALASPAMAEEPGCFITQLNNLTSNARLDFGFCFAASSNSEFSCWYNPNKGQTVCRNQGNGDVIVMDWFSDRASVYANGMFLGSFFNHGDSTGHMTWASGDIDRCRIFNGFVEWCN